MNVFNRLIMLLIALLLVAIPVAILLVAYGVLSADVVNSYTGYRSALDALEELSRTGLEDLNRVVAGVISGVVALVALLLALRELVFWRRRASRVKIDEQPGRETTVTTRGVRALAEGAALEAGAESPAISLASRRNSYRVLCKIQAPPSGDFAQLAARTQENIRRVLESQNVPVRDVEVRVQGSAS
jgi:hypothetical protein